MNLETKITIYKFTPQVFTLTPQYEALTKISSVFSLFKSKPSDLNKNLPLHFIPSVFLSKDLHRLNTFTGKVNIKIKFRKTMFSKSSTKETFPIKFKTRYTTKKHMIRIWLLPLRFRTIP